MARLVDDKIDDEAIGFHTQQVVEKAFKALLTQLKVRYVRTHDLAFLIDLLEDKYTSGQRKESKIRVHIRKTRDTRYRTSSQASGGYPHFLTNILFMRNQPQQTAREVPATRTRWTQTKALQALVAFEQQFGRFPNSKELEAPSKWEIPNRKTLSRLFGSYIEAVAVADQVRNSHQTI